MALSQKVSRKILHQKKEVDLGSRRQFLGWKKEGQGSPNMTPVQESKKSVIQDKSKRVGSSRKDDCKNKYISMVLMDYPVPLSIRK